MMKTEGFDKYIDQKKGGDSMKRTIAFLLALFMLLPCLPVAAAEKGSPSQDSELVHVVVQLRDNGRLLQKGAKAARTMEQQQNGLVEKAENCGIDMEVEYHYTAVMNGMGITMHYDDLEALRAMDSVENAWVATTYTLPETYADNTLADLSASLNDSDFGCDGEGTVIAVLDTGIDLEHEAFCGYGETVQPALGEADVASCVQSSFGVYISEKIPFACNYAAKTNKKDVTDKNGHGTHVAGIMAGYARNEENNVIFRGVAPAAQLLVMKIFDDTTNTTDATIYLAALDDACKLNADVINMSIGILSGFSENKNIEDNVLGNIYQKLQEAGILVCAAAGNGSSMAEGNVTRHNLPRAAYADYGTVASPSTFHEIISVASADDAQRMSDFSSWGCTPDLKLKPQITAPGENIISAGLNGNTYVASSGTSMASPNVAANMALLLAYEKAADPALSKKERAEQAEKRVLSTAYILTDDSGTAYSPRRQGAGMLQEAAAAQTAAYLTDPILTLGDDPEKTGVYTLRYTVKNTGEENISFFVDAQVLCDQLWVSEDGTAYNALAAEEMISRGWAQCTGADIITVPAYGEETIHLTVTLTESGRAALADFENGTFVEGYVTLTPDNDTYSAIHGTFLGFYGNWLDAPMLESYDTFDDTALITPINCGINCVKATYYDGLQKCSDDINLDLEDYRGGKAPAQCACITSTPGDRLDNQRFEVSLQPMLLRNARSLRLLVQDAETGSTYYEIGKEYVPKAEYRTSSKQFMAATTLSWRGETQNGTPLADGTKVNMELYGTLDYAGAQEQLLWSVPLFIDNEAPRAEMTWSSSAPEIYGFHFSDNHYLMHTKAYYQENSISHVQHTSFTGGETSAQWNFDLSKHEGDITQLRILTYDYAGNCHEAEWQIGSQFPIDVTAGEGSRVDLLIKDNTVTASIAADDHHTLRNVLLDGESVGDIESYVFSDASETHSIVTISELTGAHDYVPAVTAPTCTEEGYTTYRCACGSSYIAQPVPANGHNFGEDGRCQDCSARISVGLDYILSDDGTHYLVSGIGTCTDQDIILSATYHGLTISEIADDAFRGAELVSIVLPDTITNIGKQAFFACDRLADIYYPGTQAQWESIAIGENNAPLRRACLHNQRNCAEGLNYTLIHDGTAYAVSGIGNCKENILVIPNLYQGLPVTEIGDGAFRDCSNLTEVVLTGCVTNVGRAAFSGCTGLTEVFISDSVAEIADFAFSGCTRLTDVYYTGTQTQWDDLTIGSANTALTNAAIHTLWGTLCKHSYAAQTIAAGCITNGSILYTCVDCGDSYTQSTPPQGHSYVDGICIRCGEKKISEGLKYTLNKEKTGYNVSSIGTCKDHVLIIPEEYNGLPVTGLADYAFYSATALTGIILPENITMIGSYAFYGCTGLDSMTIPAHVTTIGSGAFSGCNGLKDIHVAEDNAAYCDMDGVLFTKDRRTLLQYPPGRDSTDYVIPKGVRALGDSAFEGCENLTRIAIPAGVSVLGSWTFAQCTGLVDICIPESVTAIGKNVFVGCTALRQVSISQSVTAIGDRAFYSCSCLSDVYYAGSQEDWKKISIGASNSALTGAEIHFCQEAPCVHRYLEAPIWNWITKDGSITAVAILKCAMCGSGEVCIPAAVTTTTEDSRICYAATVDFDGMSFHSIRIDPRLCTLTVIGGKITAGGRADGYPYNALITVQANAAPQGKYFSGWYLNDVKVSENSTFKFYLKTDTILEARYEDTPTEKKPVLGLELTKRALLDDGKAQMKLIVRWEMPAGFRPICAGFVRSYDTDDADVLLVDNVDGSIIKNNSVAVERNTGSYTLNLSLSAATRLKSLYTVGYITYTDPSGKMMTLYTPMEISPAM